MMNARLPLTLLVAVVILGACQTVPTDIPEDLTLGELIQLAQESVDAENWNAALAYYEAILDRFPDDRAAVATARYEIGFIYFRRDDFDQARIEFAELLAMYDTDAGQIPEWPRVLANTLLDEISGADR